ncbi:Mediator of RNA polymerase II transcription subunit 28 [Hibiscus syriacus]|uniref:Mediator of RNA polymerase II transcription subunit 28 n=1 Tax=Hibiscus syriacus TaxID=106335 RepID=A0A6A3AK16_HIBSY|nr:Mediator of RNA polymerase II transcription subunit 28 [Hibiscus syriacus]
MSERQELQLDPQIQSPQGSSRDDMISWVIALETALLPCLPARELQVIDRSPHPSHQIDVERHARDFMEAAKKLQLYFLGLQRDCNSGRRIDNEVRDHQESGETDPRMEEGFE